METLKCKIVKTRSPHHCHGCGRSFPPKSRLRYTVQVDGGEIVCSYWCEVCDEVMSAYEIDDGVAYGELRSADVDYWEEIKKKIDERNKQENYIWTDYDFWT